jgi:chromosome segregation ATPase
MRSPKRGVKSLPFLFKILLDCSWMEYLLKKQSEFQELITDLTRQKDELISDNTYLQSMYDQVKNRESQKNEKIVGLEKELEEAQEKTTRLKEENKWLEDRVEALMQEREREEDVIETKEEKMEDQQHKYLEIIDNLKAEINEKTIKIKNLEDLFETECQSSDSISKEKDRLKHEIDNHKNSYEELREK